MPAAAKCLRSLILHSARQSQWVLLPSLCIGMEEVGNVCTFAMRAEKWLKDLKMNGVVIRFVIGFHVVTNSNLLSVTTTHFVHLKVGSHKPSYPWLPVILYSSKLAHLKSLFIGDWCYPFCTLLSWPNRPGEIQTCN